MSSAAQPPRVLVVDDEEPIRTFAAAVLRGSGYEVELASEPAQALRLIGERPAFDLFLLDVMMPQMRGDELAAAIRRVHPDAKILYLTGYSDELFTQRPVLWQDEAFLAKPASIDGLLEGVSFLLFGHRRGPAGASQSESIARATER
jgi:CheY-like chemotaxis protein